MQSINLKNALNATNKVLLHYKRIASTYEMIDMIVDNNLQFEHIDESGTLVKVDAIASEGKKASLPLNLDTTCNFDNDYVRKGYAWTFPNGPKGRLIKLPKKETELRELFELTDPKKASLRSLDYGDINVIELQKNGTDIQKLSFIRGVFSAKAKIRPGKTGYISWSFDTYGNENIISRDDDNIFLDVITSMLDCNSEHNTQNVFIASRKQIYEYITKVGFVQKFKMDDAITSYRLHLRTINKVVPIDEKYLLYHVANFGNPEDYNDELSQLYDVNITSKKRSGDTPLDIALSKIKHDSLYPAIWLLNHGANTNNVGKLLQESPYYLSGLEYYGTFMATFLKSKYQNNKRKFTEEVIECFCIRGWDSKWYSVRISEVQDLVRFSLEFLDENSVLEILIKSGKKLDYRNYDQNMLLLLDLVNHSNEDLVHIMDKTLDKILEILIEGGIVKFNGRKSRSNVVFQREHLEIFESYYYEDLDLYIPLYDCLKKRVPVNNTKVSKIQNLIESEKILLYRRSTEKTL